MGCIPTVFCGGQHLLGRQSNNQAHTEFEEFGLGVVDCTKDGLEYGPEEQALADAFLTGRALMAESGRCRLLSAER
jgi:hypothetical protein